MNSAGRGAFPINLEAEFNTYSIASRRPVRTERSKSIAIIGMEDILRFSRVPASGIYLHVAEAGPAGGPPVFLLHGFPEFWYGWRNQIGPLSERGFHVIVPDQRGYNLSDKPSGISSYDLDQLAADVVALADHFRLEKFAVAGHDWGASVGWWLAGQHPSRLTKLAALSAPHPAIWQEAMRRNPEQKRKSGYVRLFQIPYLPESLIRLNPKALRKSFRDVRRPHAFTEADLQQYEKAWTQPGALSAMIHYYRALWKKQFLPPQNYRTDLPVLFIWGDREEYAVPELADGSASLCPNGRLVRLPHATHWVLHDEPEQVSGMLIEFFSSA